MTDDMLERPSVDDTFAAQFGLVWTEDLFAEGGTDPRFTDQVELFMTTQQAWLEGNLPPKGHLLEVDSHGDCILPPKAQCTTSPVPPEPTTVTPYGLPTESGLPGCPTRAVSIRCM